MFDTINPAPRLTIRCFSCSLHLCVCGVGYSSRLCDLLSCVKSNHLKNIYFLILQLHQELYTAWVAKINYSCRGGEQVRKDLIHVRLSALL